MGLLVRMRFIKGLSSSLSVLAFLAVGYSLDGESRLVFAAGDDTNSNTHLIGSPNESKGFPDGVDGERSEATTEQIRIELRESNAMRSFPGDPIRGASDSIQFDDFHATAYCLKGRTAAGEYTRRGIIAADPRVLPLGTVVSIEAGSYSGEYTVKDTGRLIKGRKIDLYVPSYREARQFGRQRVKLAVLSLPKTKKARSAATLAD